MAFTETPDSGLNVIIVVLGPYQPLGPEHLCYLSGAHREWKLKDPPVAYSKTVLFASPRLCEIVAAVFSGKNDVPHPDPQCCLFIWARQGVSAGKVINNGFLSHRPAVGYGSGLVSVSNAWQASTGIGYRTRVLGCPFSYSQPDRLNPNHSPLQTTAIPTRVAS